MDYFSHKVKEFKELVALIEELKAQGKTVVQCHGVFDLIHPGHIHYFKQAKDLGDVLVVTVVPDTFATEKGPTRPYFKENARLLWVAAIDSVDYVTANPYYLAGDAIRELKPHIYCKGETNIPLSEDPSTGVGQDKIAIEAVGGTMHFTNELPIHSTDLFNAIFKS